MSAYDARPYRDSSIRWKTWARGAREVAVEIVSESDASEETWEE